MLTDRRVIQLTYGWTCHVIDSMELMTDTLTDRQSSRMNHIYADRQMSHSTDI